MLLSLPTVPVVPPIKTIPDVVGLADVVEAPCTSQYVITLLAASLINRRVEMAAVEVLTMLSIFVVPVPPGRPSMVI